MTKNDIFAGESNKKIILISFNGVLKHIELDKVSKSFGISCFKAEKFIMVIPDFSKISAC